MIIWKVKILADIVQGFFGKLKCISAYFWSFKMRAA
jgi:hypothetical protein